MAEVLYDRATRHYADTERPAVDSLTLEVSDGELTVFVGPSGCGKSTSLRMLAGLEVVNAGTIRIGDADVTHAPPKKRDVAMVFQSYALYPHMSVADNMGYALKLARMGKDDRDGRVLEAARILDLEPYLDRLPKALSGGQRQRVAMGRAIVRQPQVFLMDEPLSNLDAKLRVATRIQIAALQRRLGTTTVYVTHDQTEAMTLGDRVAVLKDGVLQQYDTPLNLYRSPTNVFVAGFIGSPAMNIADFHLVAGHARVGHIDVPLPRSVVDAVAEEGGVDTVTLGFRPESLEMVDQHEGFPVRVDVVEELGSDAYVYGTIQALDGSDAEIAGHAIGARVDARRPPSKGDVICFRVRPGEEHAFSSVTGKRIS